MGKIKKQNNTKKNLDSGSTFKNKVASECNASKGEQEWDMEEMEKDMEDAVIRQLRSHKEWLMNKKNKKQRKMISSNTNNKTTSNNKNVYNIRDNLVSILKSLNEDTQMNIATDNNSNNNNENNSNNNNEEVMEGDDGADKDVVDDDVRSVITSKTFKGLAMKKNMKMKMKKKMWKQKIALIEKHMNNNELSIRRKAPPSLKDLSSINHSLDTVTWLNEGFKKGDRCRIKNVTKDKISQKMEDGIKNFYSTNLNQDSSVGNNNNNNNKNNNDNNNLDPFAAVKHALMRKIVDKDKTNGNKKIVNNKNRISKNKTSNKFS